MHASEIVSFRRRDDDGIGCPTCGREGCEDPSHIAAWAAPVPQRDKAPRLAVQRAEDAMAAPRAVEVVEGLAWARCVTAFVSESGTGKTFVLLDLAAAVSDGVRWHGRDVQQGSVVHISYEGD